MLPCLDALSLTSHDASPTGERNEATKPRRPLDMNKILKNTTEVHKRAALARGRGGSRGTPNYDEDAPPPRMSIQEGDNRCPECPSYVGEWSPPYSGVYKPLNEQMFLLATIFSDMMSHFLKNSFQSLRQEVLTLTHLLCLACIILTLVSEIMKEDLLECHKGSTAHIA